MKLPPLLGRAALAASLFLLCPSAAPQTAPRLDGLFPAGARRGETLSVTFQGQGLTDVRGVYFGGSGLRGEVQRTSQVQVSGEGVTASLAGNTSVQVRVTAARDAALGLREVRLITGQGVTNARYFEVGDLPEVVRAQAPSSEARPVTLPAALNGRLLAEDQVDTYTFTAAAGQRLVFDVKAERLGSSADLSAAVVDSTGKELAAATDTIGVDPLLELEVPASGTYALQIRETAGLAGPGYFYRVNAGALPYIHSAFPLGGQRGTSVEVTLGGANLNGTATTRVDIAADAPLGARELRVSTPAGPSNAWPFLVGDLPEVLEPEAPDGPLAVGVPVVVNGRLSSPGESDLYRFTPQAGDTLIFEVIARRLGSPLDSLLVLEDAQGKEIARNDDAVGKDSLLRHTFAVPEGAAPGATLPEHRLRVSDAVKRGGEAHNYRLSIRKPAPDFTLTVEQESVSVPAGGKTPLKVRVERLDGYEGPVAVEVSGLPEGVTASGLVIPAGETEGTLALGAEEGAPRVVAGFRVSGTGEGASGPIRRDARVRVVIPRQNDALGDLPTLGEQVVAAVVDPPPFTLELSAPQVTLKQRGQVQILVRARRKGDFAGPIRLDLESPPPGLSAVLGSEIRGGQSEGLLTLSASDDAAPGASTVTVRGTALVGTQEVVQPAGVLPVTVTQAPGFRLRVRPAELQLPFAGTGDLELEVERLSGFEGEVTVTPKTPAGLSAEPVTLLAGAATARMRVTADSAFQPGRQASITLEAVGRSGSEALTRSATVAVRALEPPDFAIAFEPRQVTLRPGQTAAVTLTAMRKGGFSGPIALTHSMPTGSGLTLQSSGIAAGATKGELRITAAAAAAPAVVSGILLWGTALLQGKAATREAPGRLTVTVEKPEPPPAPARPAPAEPAKEQEGAKGAQETQGTKAAPVPQLAPGKPTPKAAPAATAAGAAPVAQAAQGKPAPGGAPGPKPAQGKPTTKTTPGAAAAEAAPATPKAAKPRAAPAVSTSGPKSTEASAKPAAAPPPQQTLGRAAAPQRSAAAAPPAASVKPREGAGTPSAAHEASPRAKPGPVLTPPRQSHTLVIPAPRAPGSAAKPAPTTSSKTAAKPAPVPASRAVGKPDLAPSSEAAVKPGAAPSARAVARPTSEPSAKAAAKTTIVSSAKAAAKPASEPSAKAAAKPTLAPSSKAPVKPDSGPSKAAVRPDPGPSSRAAAGQSSGASGGAAKAAAGGVSDPAPRVARPPKVEVPGGAGSQAPAAARDRTAAGLAPVGSGRAAAKQGSGASAARKAVTQPARRAAGRSAASASVKPRSRTTGRAAESQPLVRVREIRGRRLAAPTVTGNPPRVRRPGVTSSVPPGRLRKPVFARPSSPARGEK